MHKISEKLLEDIVKCLHTLGEERNLATYEKLIKGKKKSKKIIKIIKEDYLKSK